MLGNRTPIRIVSEQSTSRPGCILELDSMIEAVHDWKQTQFLHVFQQQLLTGQRLLSNTTSSGSTVEEKPVVSTHEIIPTPQRKSICCFLTLYKFELFLIFFSLAYSAFVSNATEFANESHGVDAISCCRSSRILGL